MQRQIWLCPRFVPCHNYSHYLQDKSQHNEITAYKQIFYAYKHIK